jgi:hypothetical protein
VLTGDPYSIRKEATWQTKVELKNEEVRVLRIRLEPE